MSAPTLFSPADSTVGLPTNPTFRWNAVNGVTSYRVQVSNSSSFSGLFYVNQGGIADTSYTAANLPKNLTYYWRVCGVNAGGGGPYSISRSFATVKGYKLGDPDNGGEVSAADAAIILRHVAGLSILTGLALEAADVSGDGTVSAYDAGLVLQFAAGLITRFPAEH